MKILITKRSFDYHACIEGDKTRWGSGKTAEEAIGSLIMSHPDPFNIKIV